MTVDRESSTFCALALYEYCCPDGHRFEVFHPMGEEPEVRCEVCDAPAQRVLSPPNIHTQYYFSPQIRGAKRPRDRKRPEASA